MSAWGVFVASNHAMYRFSRSADGRPQWTGGKYTTAAPPQTGHHGARYGYHPHATGYDFVAITDNADGRIKVVVYRQQPAAGESPLFCQLPVFKPDRAPRKLPVAFGDSFIVENNFGYQGPTIISMPNPAWRESILIAARTVAHSPGRTWRSAVLVRTQVSRPMG